MARLEADKEDLIAEASALVDRFEFARTASEGGSSAENGHDPPAQEVVTGYRRDGSFSIYFGQNPFYQFNRSAELRRAWEDGFLYRSQGTTLARLERRRAAAGTRLLRTDLQHAALQQFKDRMKFRLQRFVTELNAESYCLRRSESLNDLSTQDVRATITAVLTNDGRFLSSQVGMR